MGKWVADLRLFFHSQHFADGVRTTIAVLLPALLASFFSDIRLGMLFSLGALCVSLTDMPGAIINRVNTMLFCLFFVFCTALLTGFARSHIVLMGVMVSALSFFFSMFLVYGQRGAAVGNAAILVMVLSMDHQAAEQSIVLQTIFICCGGLWYLLVSLVAHQTRPFRTAQRSLGACIRELGVFLRIKADFYEPDKDIDKTYNSLLAQQVAVSEKQDAVREILFKTRQIVKDSSPAGRKLLLAFTDSVDLFEEITAAYYDYGLLRKQFAPAGLLSHIAAVARQMARELDVIGSAIQTNTAYQPQLDMSKAMQQLKKDIDAAGGAMAPQSNLVLKKLLVNIRRMMQRTADLRRYFSATEMPPPKAAVPFERFVTHQSLQPQLLLDNLHIKSSVFRHSLRVAIAAAVGFGISKFIAPGHHSYWILMTIIFMLKPSFSLTRQRNFERVTGTLAGGAIGICMLLLVHNKYALFALMVLFMIGTYSTMRHRYLLSVLFMTPFILILFSFLGIGFVALLQERVVDTFIGCIIALAAGYLLFPAWESEQVAGHVTDLLKANIAYLLRTAEMLTGKSISTTEYKLARKEVYVASANLSAAFQRMLSEPRSKQKSKLHLQQFVTLNHILFSNTATIAAALLAQPPRPYPEVIIKPMRKTLRTLCDSLQKLQGTCIIENIELQAATATQVLSADEIFIKEQLAYMQHLGEDIAKAVDKIGA